MARSVMGRVDIAVLPGDKYASDFEIDTDSSGGIGITLYLSKEAAEELLEKLKESLT